jgi:MFS family permease
LEKRRPATRSRGAFLGERAVWALLSTTFITNWTAWFMYSWLPTYFVQAHGFSLKESGLVSAVPSLAMIVAGLVSGWIADRLIATGMPVTRVRRLVLGSGFAGAMAFLLVIPRVSTGAAAVACLSGALACFALGASTVLVNSQTWHPAMPACSSACRHRRQRRRDGVSLLGGAIVANTGAGTSTST